MSAQITYRQLDVSGDPVWGQGQANYLKDLQAVTQAILTRLRLFEGEWWTATQDGLPLWQSILGQSASAPAQQQIASLISARITGTSFVIGITNLQIGYVPATRAFSYTATVNTQFGQLTITNQPVPPSGSLPS